MSPETASWLLAGAHAFQGDPALSAWEEVSREDFTFLLTRVVFPNQTFDEVIILLEKVVAGDLAAPSIPPDMENLIFEWEKAKQEGELARQIATQKMTRFLKAQETLASQKAKVGLPLAQAVKEVQREEAAPKKSAVQALEEAEETLATKIDQELKKQDPSLMADPDLSQELAHDIKEKMVARFLQTPERGFRDWASEINQELQKRGVGLKPKESLEFVESIERRTQDEAAKIKKIGQEPLPQEVEAKLASQTEGVALSPLYLITQPQVAAKVAFASLGKALFWGPTQYFSVADAPAELKAMIQEGKFAENILLTIKRMDEAGLPRQHPTRRKLEDQLARILEVQKRPEVRVNAQVLQQELEQIIMASQEAGVAENHPAIQRLKERIETVFGLQKQKPNQETVVINAKTQTQEIRQAIRELTATGLSPDHPIIQKLEKQFAAIIKAQKDKSPIRLFKAFHLLDELTGQPLYNPETKTYLARNTAWSKPGSVANKVRGVFNNLGSALKLYEKVSLGPGKTVFRFSLPTKIFKFFSGGKFESFGATRTFVFRQTVGKAALAFGKTAVGQALKEGFKKSATALLTRLGFLATEGGLAAAGVAAAPATLGLSLIITAAIEIGLKIVKKVWKLIKPWVEKLVSNIKKPEVALGAILVGAAAVVFLPAAAAFGFTLMGLGAFGLAMALPSMAGALASGVSSFFGALFALPSTATPIATFILATLGGLGLTSFFVLMVISGAFVLPTGKGGGTPGLSPLPEVAPRPGSGNPLAEQVVYRLLVECQIKAVNSSTWSGPGGVLECLQTSNLPNKQYLIDRFYESLSPSVDSCQCLQCVGFVRGVMGAEGLDPGGRDAKNYLNWPTPVGYLPANFTMEQVQAGDLVIRTGSLWGHIGIVISRDGNTIIVAQAWGDQNGLVNITPYHYSQFNGFLRPQ